ncbi:MAG: tetratricopeptide repeat protein [Acidimicrobiaceae bacterium]|nr:tetratricopeptide repeat protein [Acidimicrobiaceae bacterium]
MSANARRKLAPQAAILRGNDYQHAIAWLWVSRMLSDPARIVSVSVEDPEGGAFDDVVVRRHFGPDLYIQAKSSNYGSAIIDDDWLLEADSPASQSCLQRFYSTFRDLEKTSDQFVLELWTNRGFDSKNPLLGKLRDLKHHRIDTRRMLDAGPRSKVGRERDRWAQHLGVGPEELAACLAVVRWKQTESELDIRQQAQDCMALAGLRSDEPAVMLGVSLVRDRVADGCGPLDAEAAGRLVAKMQMPRSPKEPRDATDDERTDRLPPPCVTHLRGLRQSSPEAAERVQRLLEQPASLVPGVLAHQVEEPPEWLMEAGHLAWEAIAGFLNGHELPGGDAARRVAVRLGSPRGDLYRLKDAHLAALDGNVDHAEMLLREAAPDHPLHEATRALVAGDARTAVTAIVDSDACESQDPDIALNALLMLAQALHDLGQLDETRRVLEDASRRFPDRGSLYLHQARLCIERVKQRQSAGIAPSGLLESAVKLGLKARDLYRRWGGPSAAAVAAATEALLMLDEPKKVCDLATPGPEGQAIQEEAADAAVVTNRAHALLMLDRHDELEDLDWNLIDASEGALMVAYRARSRGDPDAAELMRKALDEATDDSRRLMALHGLALVGELDEAALDRIDGAEDQHKALIRAVASYHREDYGGAVELLARHGLATSMHAQLLARAQHRLGETDDAVDTLTQAVERLGDASLHLAAVEILKERERLQEAEALALRALGGPMPRSDRRRLLCALVDIVQSRRDWPAMEQHARKLLEEFPDETMAIWAIVHSQLSRGDRLAAWRVIAEHDAKPFDKDTALSCIQAYQSTEVTASGTERLLDIASEFAHDEEVAAAALMALMLRADDTQMTETERSRLAAAFNSHFDRFDEGQILRRFEFATAEDAIETMESMTATPSIEQLQVLGLVRLGQAPYGMLQGLRMLPYAELLVGVAAGHLTAVSLDDEERQREREAARSALGGVVAADTSVAALAVHTGISIDESAAAFKRVLIADDLVTDARSAVVSASLPVAGSAFNDPVAGGLRLTDTQEQHAHHREKVARLADILQRWRSVPSGGLAARWDDETAELEAVDLSPWDASLRVASNRQCALWCDDIALRRWARSEGIPTFGTYALWEVLTSRADTSLSLELAELKASLLREGIADVPLTWDELTAIADADSTGRAAFNFLARPANWHHPPLTFQWYSERLGQAAATEDVSVMCGLLRAASTGFGTSVDPSIRRHPLSYMLATAVLGAQNLEVVPALVLASRYACWEIEPSGDLDVLPDAAAALFDAYLAELAPAQAAQAVLVRFRECEEQDRRTVTSAVLSSHVEHQGSVLPAPGLATTGGVPRIARTRTAVPTRADARRAADALSAIGARQVLLFGSVAQGNPNLESDIDLVAVFDDLGDYRSRHNIETQARKAVEDACGWASDILITDRVEWSVRSKLATTVEAEIAQSCSVLLDLPVAGPIDWDKTIGRPADDTQEAVAELRLATRHMRVVCEYARGTRGEHDAERARDDVRIETARYDRMRVLCERSHSAASAALRAYTKGVIRQRPRRGQGRGRFVATLDQIPADKRSGLETALRVPAGCVDAWEQKPGASLPSAVLESVTPALAADMVETAIGCCAFAARSIESALGPVQEARDLLETVSAADMASAIATIRRGPPIAGVAYEVNGLNPPSRREEQPGPRLPSRKPEELAGSKRR